MVYSLATISSIKSIILILNCSMLINNTFTLCNLNLFWCEIIILCLFYYNIIIFKVYINNYGYIMLLSINILYTVFYSKIV